MTNADDAPSRIDLPDAPPDQQAILDEGGVACWSEPVEIDSYEPGEPDRYPLFLDRRVYQGSSGKVYPIPFVDRISPHKVARRWQAIHLENQWVRLLLLPEIGGRIHIGFDKTRGYDFFYRNNVIKPALVGLAGPWISGGVEFNWPQHHRPATFLPVETSIEREGDGLVTVWHSDLDPLQRMRGDHGVRLRGDSSVIEVAARLHNRTDEPQTFLWWANVAARSHEHYQSFFPLDVHYVADHARRAITSFPRADRPYYGVDYPALADPAHPDADRLDFYRNIPVPTSYMITDTRDSFFGGYDHAAGAGFVHWADHAISPGKKQWTWGDGPVGHAWDAQLTDTDGPYVELMAGVFTDNQPDFSYLAAAETRSFSQYWYPIQDIGAAHQATRQLAVRLDADTDAAADASAAADADAAGAVRIGVASAVRLPGAVVVLEGRAGDEIGRWTADLEPGRPFRVTVAANRDDDARASGRLTLRVLHRGAELISHSTAGETGPADDTATTGETSSADETGPADETGTAGEEPWLATEPPQPADILSIDELYLTGVHLQQYRHPTRSPLPYFDEVLRRDPDDSRALIAVGAIDYRHGRYDLARERFERALARLTRRNLNPASGEAGYRLGLVLERKGDLARAADHFGKAAWDTAWALPAHLALSRIALRQGRATDALEHAVEAGNRDASNPDAPVLAVLAFEALGDESGARQRLEARLAADPLDAVALSLAALRNGGFARFADPKTALTVAVELARRGRVTDALALTDRVVAPRTDGTAAHPAFGNPVPIAHYLRAQWRQRSGDPGGAARERQLAREADSRLAFPYGLDEHDALVAALDADPTDPVAAALLGCWLLDAGRTSDALTTLKVALENGSADPVAWRNAAIATVNTGGDADLADTFFAEALRLSPGDARLIVERDILARLRGVGAAQRLRALDDLVPLVLSRDDLTVNYLELLVTQGRADEVLAILATRRFQPFEGGEGRVIAVFDDASVAVARAQLESSPAEVAARLQQGIEVPANLGEGRHPASSTAERLLLVGDALDRSGDAVGATEAWRRARSGAGPLAVAPRPAEESDFWVGVAHARLREFAEAEHVWLALENRARELDHEKPAVDYFATSLPELLLFDIDTADARAELAARLRGRAAEGRALCAEAVASEVSPSTP
ncbi:DUF5107 domain-containing protein [Herbiconiux daphne]|uniref:DUF5107 domain-containing protein n=1 Tax=Herbiconiux daphne TaxID=2970914 RepID=A0ABT2H3D3_9MICO|nr:DUF5107 domain-containing protein [Herbiconiux daphne]MCS5734448.1 DUF5107 domain-containing protein [Herbiconiux daphne]